MATAFTAYGTVTASTTITTANTLLENASVGAAVTNKNTNLVSNTVGWVEMRAQSNSTASSGATSEPAPSGYGWCDDTSSTLSGQQFASGTWTATLQLETTATGSFVADIHVRAYQLSSSGIYTLIAEMIATNQTIVSTAYTTYTVSASSVPASNVFASTDHLYCDVLLNILTNGTTGNVRMEEANSSTLGSVNMRIVTPGFQPAVSVVLANVIEQATTTSELVNTLQAYSITEQSPTAQETVLASIPKTLQSASVVEQETAQEMITTFPTLIARVIEAALTQETVTTFPTQISTIIEQTPTSSEIAKIIATTVSDPSAQMITTDLDIQYARIIGSPAFQAIDYVAYVYYGSTADKTQQGELDAVMIGESANQARQLRTINDVTNFLRSYAYRSVILNDGPVAYYRLGDSGSVATDLANGYTGILNGGITPGQPGAIAGDPDTSMQLDGSTGYITLPGSLDTSNWGNISIECWINPTNTISGNPRVITNDLTQTSFQGFELLLNSSGSLGSFTVGIGSSGRKVNFGSAPGTPGSWYHIVATFDGTTVAVYINGTISASSTKKGVIAGASYPINIGRSPSGVNYLNASIDEVAIYNHVLSPSQILYHYQIGTGVLT